MSSPSSIKRTGGTTIGGGRTLSIPPQIPNTTAAAGNVNAQQQIPMSNRTTLPTGSSSMLPPPSSPQATEPINVNQQQQSTIPLPTTTSATSQARATSSSVPPKPGELPPGRFVGSPAQLPPGKFIHPSMMAPNSIPPGKTVLLTHPSSNPSSSNVQHNTTTSLPQGLLPQTGAFQQQQQHAQLQQQQQVNRNVSQTGAGQQQQQQFQQQQQNINTNKLPTPPPKPVRKIPITATTLDLENQSDDIKQLHKRLMNFFTHHSPHLCRQVESLIIQYHDRESELWEVLTSKYGKEPPFPSEGQDVRSRLIRYFRRYDPSFEGKVDRVLDTYAGHHDVMWKALIMRYGPEPEEYDPLKVQKKEVPMDINSRLTRFFENNDPKRVVKVDELIVTYKDRELDLRDMLQSLYNDELEAPPKGWGKDTRGDPAAQAKAQRAQEEELERLRSIQQEYEEEKKKKEENSPSRLQVEDAKRKLNNYISYLSPDRARQSNMILRQFEGKEIEALSTLEQLFGSAEDLKRQQSSTSSSTTTTSRDTNTAAATTTTSNNNKTYFQRLIRFYKKYDPPQLMDVEAELESNKGNEEALFKALCQKYGNVAEPRDDEVLPSEEKPPKGTNLERVTRMFERYDSKKVPEVTQTLAQFKGKEDRMWAILIHSYGAEPPATFCLADLHRERLARWYHRYEPEKLAKLDANLEKFKGREESEMFPMLAQKYSSVHREKLTEFYNQYDPSRVDNVDKVLGKYQGREQEMWFALDDKYKTPAPSLPALVAQAKLVIVVLSASNMKSMDTFGKSDPFCTVKCCGNKFQTKSISDQHNPVWNESFSLMVPAAPMNETIFFTLFDEDTTSNDQIGSVTVPLRDVIASNGGKQRYKLSADSGELSVEYILEGAAASPTSTSTAAVAAASSPTTDARSRLIAFYTKYDSSKLEKVDGIVGKYAGREDELFGNLARNYPQAVAAGDLPPPPEDDTSASAATTTTTAAAATTTIPGGAGTTREKLTTFYTKYEPEKLAKVDGIVGKFEGREDDLWISLSLKYANAVQAGDLPPPPADALASSASISSPTSGVASSPSTVVDPSTSTTAVSSPTDTKSKLVTFYTKYDASKLEKVDGIAGRYVGREDELWVNLARNYPQAVAAGDLPAPPPEDDTSASAATTTTTAAAATTTIPGGAGTTREKLTAFYTKYEPEKLAKVDGIVGKFEGREDDLWISLSLKYANAVQAGDLPPPPADALASSASISSPTSAPAEIKMTLVVSAGHNLKSMDTFGKSDPFCTVKCCGNKFQTKSISDQHNPVWNESFSLMVPAAPMNETIFFTLFDEDTTSNDQIGSVTVPLRDVIASNGGKQRYKLSADSGELSVEYILEGAASPTSTSTAAATTTTIPAGPGTTREKLTAFYTKYEPEKLAKVDGIVGKFEGREDDLWISLSLKYANAVQAGDLPPPPADALDSSTSISSPTSGVASSPSTVVDPSTSTTAVSSPTDTKSKLVTFYAKYDSSKLEKVDGIAGRYVGREDELWVNLARNYPQAVAAGDLPAPPPEDAVSASAAATTTTIPAGPGTTREKLTAFYTKYEPEKLAKVDGIVGKFEGREDDLWISLSLKYANAVQAGDLPPPPADALGSSTSISSPTSGVASSPSTVVDPSTSTTAVSSPTDTKSKLVTFYTKYDSSKLEKVDGIAGRYVGREDELWVNLARNYPQAVAAGDLPAPPPEDDAAAASSPTIDTRSRLIAFYTKYDSSKLEKVDGIVGKYSGRENELWTNLAASYPQAVEAGDLPAPQS